VEEDVALGQVGTHHSKIRAGFTMGGPPVLPREGIHCKEGTTWPTTTKAAAPSGQQQHYSQ